MDSKETTPHLYTHRATGFECEGVKSVAQGDISGTMSGAQTVNLGVVRCTLSMVTYGGTHMSLI